MPTHLLSCITGGYKLVKDDFLPLEPGLSSFGSDAKAAAQSLKPLLEYARQKVPQNRHKDCPIEVKATAGLRILSEQVANEILREVSHTLRVSCLFLLAKNPWENGKMLPFLVGITVLTYSLLMMYKSFHVEFFTAQSRRRIGTNFCSETSEIN